MAWRGADLKLVMKEHLENKRSFPLPDSFSNLVRPHGIKILLNSMTTTNRICRFLYGNATYEEERQGKIMDMLVYYFKRV